MLQFSDVKTKMDSLQRRYTSGKINRKQACAELRKFMQEQQRRDIYDAIELFKEGWIGGP